MEEDAAVTAKPLVVALIGVVFETNPSMQVDDGRGVLPSIPLLLLLLSLLLLLVVLRMESRSFNCCVSDFDKVEESFIVVVVVVVVVLL